MDFRELDGEQSRRLIDAEQRYEALLGLESRLYSSFRGSMSWKTVAGRDYLYRKVDGQWKSLGPRDEERERLFAKYHGSRSELRNRIAMLRSEVDRAARVDRAMGLGRVPKAVAAILRRLDRKRLLGKAVSVVGTNALYAYERLAGGHFPGSMLATFDVDLLFDSRGRLGLVARDVLDGGLAGLLKSVDASFSLDREGSFRAINGAGLMVDLIEPLPANPSSTRSKRRIGNTDDDLIAAEIEGLQWLQNVRHLQVILLDEAGLPLRMSVPDPRAFALHKLWVSKRPDRDRLKARRDEAQARAVAGIIADYLPAFNLEDDLMLTAVPEALRAFAGSLLADRKAPPKIGDWR